jgi:spore maturation protein CgeB
MKILFVAPKYDYGIPEWGFSFEYYNFFDTLVGMGHEVEFFDFFTLFHAHGREEMTGMLAGKMESMRPDLMFTFLFSDQFDFERLKKISQSTGALTFNWFADDHWRFDDFSRHWAPCFSFVSTTDPQAVPKYHASGYRNVLLTQWAANPRIYARGNGPARYDVTFVGQPYGDRKAILQTLARRGIRIRTWGSAWNVTIIHRLLRKFRLLNDEAYTRIKASTRLTQEEMIAVFQSSRINLNLSSASSSDGAQIKGRNFEIPACGGFQLSGRAPRLEEFFEPDKEIVLYGSRDELVEKVQYYLAHETEREAIASAGCARVLRDHTYEQRFRELFQQMGLG